MRRGGVGRLMVQAAYDVDIGAERLERLEDTREFKVLGIAVDGSGNAYIAGYTQSYDVPVTPGAKVPPSVGQLPTSARVSVF